MVGKHERRRVHISVGDASNLTRITDRTVGQQEIGHVNAGELTDINVPNSASDKFRLKLRISERFKPLVKTDSVVTIETEGIVGDKFLEIQSGTANAPEATSSNTLPSKEPLSTANLLQKGDDLIDTANRTIKALHVFNQQLKSSRWLIYCDHSVTSADVRLSVGTQVFWNRRRKKQIP